MATRYPNGLSTYDEDTDSYGAAKFGDTDIHGDATISGDLTVEGDLTITGNAEEIIPVESWEVTGNAEIGGTLAVTGTSEFTGAITATGGVTGALTGDVTGNIKLGVLTGIDCTNDVTLTGDQKKARVILVTTVGEGKKLILDNGAAGSVYYISNGGANELEVRNVAGTEGVKIAAGETVTCITTSATAIIRTTDNIADAE
jgi:cytoskeletal protein CcmA (bactofilin family)